MQRNNEYTFKSRIRFSETNPGKAVTLPGIINYFQDCSTFQSESFGLGVDYFTEHQRAWILSAWQVVVDRYPMLGEEISVHTWATEFNGFMGNRNFCMKDENGKIVAYANSIWAYMDMKKGRPARPLPEEIDVYGAGEPLEMDYASRKIELPEETLEMQAFPVRKYQIDTNGHVNNSQYVQMALEFMDDECTVRQVRVEYKKSAVLDDIIVPKVAVEEERMVVELCDTDENPYAVVEFR